MRLLRRSFWSSGSGPRRSSRLYLKAVVPGLVLPVVWIILAVPPGGGAALGQVRGLGVVQGLQAPAALDASGATGQGFHAPGFVAPARWVVPGERVPLAVECRGVLVRQQDRPGIQPMLGGR